MNQPKKDGISRRQFARRAALLSASASIVPAVSVFADTLQTPPAQQTPAAHPNLSPESQAEAEARYQQILSQYGSRIGEEILRERRMLSEQVLYLSVGELSKRIQSKQISPVELTESYLARSEALVPKLKAYARLTPELGLEQAHGAEKDIQRGHYRGPLHGIPYAAQDLLEVKGLPTTWGAKPYENQIFDYDAAAIEHLKRVGAVMIGKASMIELAGGMG